MNRVAAAIAAGLLLVLGCPQTLRAAEQAAPALVTGADALQKRIDGKVGKLIEPLKLADAAKAGRVRNVIGEWLAVMVQWHGQHDAEIGDLWAQWDKARAVVPKDEFPAEVIAHKIDDTYGSLKPAYQEFLARLAAELNPEQIDAIKERWSRSPGMERTYKAYLEIVPDLTEEQKKVIHDRMLLAREAAMLTDSDKEVVRIFKVHKVKVEEYVGSLQWAKLHSAFGKKGKTAEPKPQ